MKNIVVLGCNKNGADFLVIFMLTPNLLMNGMIEISLLADESHVLKSFCVGRIQMYWAMAMTISCQCLLVNKLAVNSMPPKIN